MDATRVLTEDDMEENKRTFCSLLKGVERPGFRCDDLISFLDGSGFFTAPASTKFHGAYSGGLCEHSLGVYYNLCMLNESKGLNLSDGSMRVCALLHDISKIYFYKLTACNKKVYYDGGSKRDELGQFDWKSVLEWKTVPEEESAFVYGNHEESSAYLARCFVPLTMEEEAAILNHHAGTSWDSAKEMPTRVISHNALAAALHIADSISAFIDEK